MSRKEIVQKLKHYGVMPTSQRIEVASILLARPQHLSADQIIDKLNNRRSCVSKATVYNTLKLFSKQGLVKELNVDSSRKFYDSTTHAHHHFFHVESGKLTDIPDSQVSIKGLPPLPRGTEQESVEVLIRVRNKRR
ncbi:Ferric uptake regulator family protein [uncultured Woeseiaceae bacterium]|uniref:Ferric uptake regulator family protein n=1 Tax=uncultured Woeseiaceae bacterium TaxID=1983305 RepID=A0A7D9H6Y8_9GAMM|nr:Ferric uptake regulator family protein [uncultured Woeseiaceae bacterium]